MNELDWTTTFLQPSQQAISRPFKIAMSSANSLKAMNATRTSKPNNTFTCMII